MPVCTSTPFSTGYVGLVPRPFLHGLPSYPAPGGVLGLVHTLPGQDLPVPELGTGLLMPERCNAFFDLFQSTIRT